MPESLATHQTMVLVDVAGLTHPGRTLARQRAVHDSSTPVGGGLRRGSCELGATTAEWGEETVHQLHIEEAFQGTQTRAVLFIRRATAAHADLPGTRRHRPRPGTCRQDDTNVCLRKNRDPARQGWIAWSGVFDEGRYGTGPGQTNNCQCRWSCSYLASCCTFPSSTGARNTSPPNPSCCAWATSSDSGPRVKPIVPARLSHRPSSRAHAPLLGSRVGTQEAQRLCTSTPIGQPCHETRSKNGQRGNGVER